MKSRKKTYSIKWPFDGPKFLLKISEVINIISLKEHVFCWKLMPDRNPARVSLRRSGVMDPSFHPLWPFCNTFLEVMYNLSFLLLLHVSLLYNWIELDMVLPIDSKVEYFIQHSSLLKVRILKIVGN